MDEETKEELKRIEEQLEKLDKSDQEHYVLNFVSKISPGLTAMITFMTIFSTILFISYGISGNKITSAEPAIPDSKAIKPAFLPITSKIIIL